MSQPDPTEPGRWFQCLRDTSPGEGPAGFLMGIGRVVVEVGAPLTNLGAGTQHSIRLCPKSCKSKTKKELPFSLPQPRRFVSTLFLWIRFQAHPSPSDSRVQASSLRLRGPSFSTSPSDPGEQTQLLPQDPEIQGHYRPELGTAFL